MSVKALFWALEQDIPPRDKLVLVIVANYYNDDAQAAWMKQSTLAQKTGYNRVTVLHALSDLEHKHHLISSEHRRYEDGRNATKVYRLHIRVAETNTVDPSVAERNTDRVAERNTDRVAQSNSKNLKHRTKNIDTKHTSAKPTSIPYDQYLQAWNAHRRTLPKVTILNDKRKRQIAQHHKQHANALDLFEHATKAVASEPWWIQHSYGLDNLLTGNKIVTYAERHQAQNQPNKTIVTLDF